jgi:hypothetical protein
VATIEETWSWRDRPILDEVLRQSEAGNEWVGLEDVRQAVGLDVPQMKAGVTALEAASPPYIETQHRNGYPHAVNGFVSKIGERTRRECGAWPSPETIVAEIVAALNTAVENETEPEKKGLLRSMRDGALGVGHDVLVSALTAKLGTYI